MRKLAAGNWKMNGTRASLSEVKAINAELYPSKAKMKKQMTYANNLNIPFVVMIGEDELKSGMYSLKNMVTGEQTNYKIDDLISKIIE